MKSAFVVSPVSATCVMFISWSSPKLITAPSAKNKSENSSELVPKAAPSDASGTKAVSAVIVVPCIVVATSNVPGKVTLPLASSNTALLAGNVQNTSFVPDAKFTALSLLELEITVVRVRSELSPSNVPRPTSNSAAVL